MARKQRIYSAESEAIHLRHVFRDMIYGVKRSRYMAYRLCVKEIRAEYATSAFGFLWDFADPIVLGTVFYFLMRARVFNAGEMPMPYAIFVIYGLFLYVTFCESLVLPLHTIRRSQDLVNHLNLPPEALILSVIYRVSFNSVFRIIVLLGFSLALHPGAVDSGLSAFSLVGFLKFILAYPLIILAGMSFGWFLTPFNTIYTDVGRAVQLTIFPLRYLTPVLYMIPDRPPFTYVDAVNPISLTLTNLRLLATTNTIVEPVAWLLWTALFVVVFLVGWFIFHLTVPILAERA